MKKTLLLILMMILSASYAYADDLTILVEDSPIYYYDYEGMPFIDPYGNTLVPLETTMDSYGVWVEWDLLGTTAQLTKDDVTLTLPMNESYLMKGDLLIELGAESRFIDGVAYTSIRPIIEAFNGSIQWLQESNSIQLLFAEGIEDKVYELMATEFRDTQSLTNDQRLLKGQWVRTAQAAFLQYRTDSEYLSGLQYMSKNGDYMTMTGSSYYADGSVERYSSTMKTQNVSLHTSKGNSYTFIDDELAYEFMLTLKASNNFDYEVVSSQYDLSEAEKHMSGLYAFPDDNTFVQKYIIDDFGDESYYSDLYKVTLITIDQRIETENEDYTRIIEKGDSAVNFTDYELESLIRDTIGKPSGTLFKTDVEKIRTLDARNSSIYDLAGIENLTNLSILYLSSDQFEDISNYEATTNYIDDFTPLASLKNLTQLYASSNYLTDLTPLAELTKLKILHLADNGIEDITPLSNLTNLEILWLDMNYIENIEPLTQLTKLTELSLYDNQVTDLEALSNMDFAETLWLSFNQISDIRPLADLDRLQVLSLMDNQIDSVEALVNLTALKELYLGTNYISDITPLKRMSQLHTLDLYENSLSDISSLSKLENLESLWLSYNQVADITALKELDKLTHLYLEYNLIEDIRTLSSLKNLEELAVDYNYIRDFTPLAKLVKLKALYIDGNNTYDVSPLRDLYPNLEDYDFYID